MVEEHQWRPIRLSRGGLQVSHLFFADDLLLFGDVSYSQARLMEHVLQEFCHESGQRVSKDKSLLWFAPNTPGYLRASICTSFDIRASASLGICLGVHLCHDRRRKHQFQGIIDKARRRLATWKAKTLSKAARLLLIQTTLSSLPVYHMQATRFPVSVVRELDSLSRRFLWGVGEGEHKFHPLKWELVCTPKAEGGLGIPSLRITNTALLVKLAWLVLQVPHSLSSQVLQSKYGGWRVLTSELPYHRASVIWQDLQSIRHFLWKGVHWKIQSGTEISFWHDCWLRDVPLLSVVIMSPPVDFLDRHVRAFWDDDRGWDLHTLRAWVPSDILSALQNIRLTAADSSLTDTLTWQPGVDGRFSLASVKTFLRHPHGSTLLPFWRRLWKFKGPVRTSLTLWATAQDILPTRSLLWRRQIAPDAA